MMTLEMELSLYNDRWVRKGGALFLNFGSDKKGKLILLGMHFACIEIMAVSADL